MDNILNNWQFCHSFIRFMGLLNNLRDLALRDDLVQTFHLIFESAEIQKGDIKNSHN